MTSDDQLLALIAGGALGALVVGGAHRIQRYWRPSIRALMRTGR